MIAKVTLTNTLMVGLVAVVLFGCGGSGGGSATGTGTGGSSAGSTGGTVQTATTPGTLSSTSSTYDDGSAYQEIDFIARKSGSAQISVTASFDTLLDIETAGADGTSSVVAEGSGTGSTTTINVTTGATYAVFVAAASSGSGNFTVTYPTGLLSLSGSPSAHRQGVRK